MMLLVTNSLYHNPRLIYEIEAFLFQIKSGLDIFAQIISMIFNLNGISTYSISQNRDKIIKKLSEKKNHNILITELIEILKQNDNWIIDTIDMRDEITHISDLKGFMCFI